MDNGVPTALTQLSSVTITPSAGNVLSVQVSGSYIILYQNWVQVGYWADATYTGGSPGFQQWSSTPTSSQVSSWRGYSAVQQDGIWSKQQVIFPATATDLASSGVGPTNISNILHEGNAQLLSGTVYKTWISVGQASFGGSNVGIYYAESLDGKTWTRTSSPVLASYITPSVVKVGSTYYMYAQPNSGPGTASFDLQTSTDGIHWTLNTSGVLGLGSSTWDDAFLWSMAVNDYQGTFYALYSAGANTTTYEFYTGLATSSDGIHWTKYASNPVYQGYTQFFPIGVNGRWYGWISRAQPGQGGYHPYEDPDQTVRISSSDLENWVFSAQSIHTTQAYESYNQTWGQSYPNFVMDVSGQAFAYITSSLGDSGNGPPTGVRYLYQMTLAVAPFPIESLVTGNEDAAQQVASDAFTSGTGPLDSNWGKSSPDCALQIVSGNLVEPSATSAHCNAVYTGAAFSANQYSDITIHTTASGSYIYPIVRASTTSASFYEALIGTATMGTPSTYSIFKNISGTETRIGSWVTLTVQSGDIFRLQAIGNVLTLFQNGFQVLQVEDEANLLTSGSPGFAMYAGTLANAQVSAWDGGNAGVIPTYPSGANAFWIFATP
jgi:hypothetical protein